MSYADAGFNKFYSRSISSAPSINNLPQMSAAAGSNMINFDHSPTSGSLGDKIQVGGVIIDGTNRRIVIQDENGVDVGWIGNLDA